MDAKNTSSVFRGFAVVAALLTAASAKPLNDWTSPGLESAERLYSAGRFAQALSAYRALAAYHPPPPEKAWIDFRLADTRWRAQISRKPPDEAVLEAARESLEAQLRTIPSSERLFAELNESLARLWLQRPQRGESWDYPQRARPSLAAARKWWLENPIEPGRDARFLELFWLSQRQMHTELSLDEKKEALSLARSDEERAHLHLLIAAALADKWTPVDDVVKEYEAGLALGPTKWRQTLLFSYAGFMRYCGKPVISGRRDQCRPDNDRALALYAELKDDLRRNGSASTYYVDQEIAKIAGPLATAWISGAFRPGEPIGLTLRAKNLTHLEAALYALTLPDDFRPGGDPGTDALRWVWSMPLEDRTPIRRWTPAFDGSSYQDVQVPTALDPLPSGLYVLQLRSDAGQAQWPLLVSDLSLLLTRVGEHACLFVTRTRDGSGVGDAEVRIFERGDRSAWRFASARTDSNGLLVLPDPSAGSLFLAWKGSDLALLDARPPTSPPLSYRVAAFPSKSAYRRGEEVVITIQASAGDIGAIPYDIRIGEATLLSGSVSLDELGTGQVSLRLGENADLGTYRITFPGTVPPNSRPLAHPLFRIVEEPRSDLRVAMIPSTKPSPSGPAAAALLEAAVRVESQGKPVKGAQVDLTTVKRSVPPEGFRRRLDRATQLHSASHSATTDSEGEAFFSFPSQEYPACDFEYEMRAVVCGPQGERGFGRGRLRAGAPESRLRADREVVRVGERVVLRVATFDTHGTPARFEGFVVGTRRTWTEAWRSGDGRLVRGDELRRLRASGGERFPPHTIAPGAAWMIETQAWSEERMLSIPVDTGADGVTDVALTMPALGLFDLHLEVPGTSARRAGSDSQVWAYDQTGEPWGYQPESLEIRLAKDTAHPGEEVSALIATPLPDRDVLVTILGGTAPPVRDFVLRVKGNTAVVPLRFPDDGSQHISIAAAMMGDGIVLQCQKSLLLDPDWRRLRVGVAWRDSAGDGDEATIRLTDRDAHPARGEVTVVLLDGADEPGIDPSEILSARPPAPIERQTSFDRFPLASSRSRTPIQPPCARSYEGIMVIDEGRPTCEPPPFGSRPEPFDRDLSLEPDLASVLLHREAVATDESGAVTLRLPRCPATRLCRLRVWAAGLGDTYGYRETDVPEQSR